MKEAIVEKIVEDLIDPDLTENKEKDHVTMRIVLSRKQADGHFVATFNRMAEQVNDCAKTHGFWDNSPSDGEQIALIHSELSECLEALRANNPPDPHIGEFSSAEAELADVVIRAMNFARQKGYKLGDAILAKHRFNLTRPYKHGGKNF